MPDLWHYTCDHGAAGIGRTGFLQPARWLTPALANWWPARYVWLTDRPPPADMAALGLTRFVAKCDRTAHTYRVLNSDDAVRWVLVRGNHLEDPLLNELEHAYGAVPSSWWVSLDPVPAQHWPEVTRHERYHRPKRRHG